MANIKPEYLPSLGRLVTFATQVAAAITDRVLEGSGVTRVQWVVLTALLRQDGLTVRDLAGYLRVSDPAASRLLDRMEAKGLVTRGSDPSDRRVVRVWLTEEAESKRSFLGLFKDVNAVLMKGLTDDEQRTLLGLLERVVANGEAALEGPPQADGVP